jgi:alkanesulfonate monooxygenase SsuD/methylene tetrahydromethanopterin reductase-like flavin-dependent oxidoreductase (luciferase family)
MDFGLIYELGVPKPWHPRSEYDAYWNAIEQVREADRVGYSHVWAVEHHFLEEFSHSSSPEVWLATVAQHTERIRICHGVVQVPAGFNHPVRVAERAAALDILSNGRLELGTGRSITEEELGGFGIAVADSRPMWREAVELIPKLWTSEGPVTFEGTYTTIPGRSVFPKPLQKPHPPIWSACTSPTSYPLAGELGLGAIGFGMALGPDVIARRVAEYRAGLARATPVGAINDNVALFLMTFCARTDDEARQVAESSFTAYMDKTMEYFLQWGRGGELPPGYEWYAEAAKNSDKMAEHMKFDYLLEHGMVLVGTPDTIATNIRRYRDAGVTQIITGTQFGDITQDDVLGSIRLFAEAVMPEFTDVEVLSASR